MSIQKGERACWRLTSSWCTVKAHRRIQKLHRLVIPHQRITFKKANWTRLGLRSHLCTLYAVCVSIQSTLTQPSMSSVHKCIDRMKSIIFLISNLDESIRTFFLHVLDEQKICHPVLHSKLSGGSTLWTIMLHYLKAFLVFIVTKDTNNHWMMDEAKSETLSIFFPLICMWITDICLQLKSEGPPSQKKVFFPVTVVCSWCLFMNANHIVPNRFSAFILKILLWKKGSNIRWMRFCFAVQSTGETA